MKEEATEHNSGYLWQLLQSVSPPSNTKLITMTKKLIFCKEKEILFFVEKQEKTILPINDKQNRDVQDVHKVHVHFKKFTTLFYL